MMSASRESSRPSGWSRPALAIGGLLTAAGLLLSTAAVAPAGEAARFTPPEFTWDDFVSMVKAGGITMYPLGALSIAALAFTLERFLRVSKRRLSPDGLAERCDALWRNRDFAAIEQACAASQSVLGKAVLMLVRYRDLPRAEALSAAREVASAELTPHVRACKPLIIIATTAPLLGLFGTILGMIGAFRMFNLLGATGDPGVFAHNISEALVTAATGLIIAAWSLFMYHIFKNRALRLADGLGAELNDLARMWFLGEGKVATAAPAAATQAAQP